MMLFYQKNICKQIIYLSAVLVKVKGVPMETIWHQVIWNQFNLGKPQKSFIVARPLRGGGVRGWSLRKNLLKPLKITQINMNF